MIISTPPPAHQNSSGWYYVYPANTSPGRLYQLVAGRIVSNIQTDLIKNRSLYFSTSLVFSGCEAGSVDSCETLIIDRESGKVLKNIEGRISKITKDYIIISNYHNNDGPDYSYLLINDSVINKKLNIFNYSGEVKAREGCGEFSITQINFINNNISYALNDNCGAWIGQARMTLQTDK